MASDTSAGQTRKDGDGQHWTLDKVQQAVIAIVAHEAGDKPEDIKRSTRFDEDLGWDDVYKLIVLKPIRATLHEKLNSDNVKNTVKNVGALVDLVWAGMEVVP